MNLRIYKNNSKKLLLYVSHKQKMNSGIEAPAKDGKITYDKKEIPETLNKQFEFAFNQVGQSRVHQPTYFSNH